MRFIALHRRGDSQHPAPVPFGEITGLVGGFQPSLLVGQSGVHGEADAGTDAVARSLPFEFQRVERPQ